MIRLYVDQKLAKGAEIDLPDDEWRYFKSVRRGQGDVCLFNRQGQTAFGRMQKSKFIVDEVRQVSVPLYPVRVTVALPELAVVSSLVRGLSELGVERLSFFRSERSQGTAKKLNLKRLERSAIEACRQCGRGRPLEIEIDDRGLADIEFSETNRFIFDEAPVPQREGQRKDKAASVLLLGSEGGWTKQERDIARQKEFQSIHFQTPILKVETAAIAATSWALEAVYRISRTTAGDEEG